MKHVWIASAALVLLGACTSGPQPAPGQAEAASQEKKTCESRTEVGRMIPVKVCHTAAEWEAIKARQAEGVKDADRAVRSSAGTTSN